MAADGLCQEWDDLSPDERLDALRELANDWLVSAGYDAVSVEAEDLDDANGQTDNDGNIAIDQAYLRDESGWNVIKTLYHETWHSMDTQDRELNLEQEDFNESTAGSFYGYIDQHGDLQIYQEHEYDYAEHQNAEDVAMAMADEECDPDEPPPRSGTESSVDDIVLEFEFDKAVVTSAGRGSGAAGGTAEGGAPNSNIPAPEYFEGGSPVPPP